MVILVLWIPMKPYIIVYVLDLSKAQIDLKCCSEVIWAYGHTSTLTITCGFMGIQRTRMSKLVDLRRLLIKILYQSRFMVNNVIWSNFLY